MKLTAVEIDDLTVHEHSAAAGQPQHAGGHVCVAPRTTYLLRCTRHAQHYTRSG